MTIDSKSMDRLSDAILSLAVAIEGAASRVPVKEVVRTASKPNGVKKTDGPKRDPNVMPFGNNKGKTLQELEPKDLAWYRGFVAKDLENEEKNFFRESNLLTLDACDREIERRAKEEDNVNF